MLSKNDLSQIKTVVKEELRGFAKKEDLNSFAKKDDLRNFATKDDLKNFATKNDLRNLATKDDINKSILASERRLILRMGKIRNDLAERIANVALTTPTRREFGQLKQKVDARYPEVI